MCGFAICGLARIIFLRVAIAEGVQEFANLLRLTKISTEESHKDIYFLYSYVYLNSIVADLF
jgi:hypothetical protein